jgi:NADH pyrophosphatase NudC (nudix superfamily)
VYNRKNIFSSFIGMVDPGENVSVTVRREFMEEALVIILYTHSILNIASKSFKNHMAISLNEL